MAFFNDLVRSLASIQGLDPMTVRGIGIRVRDGGFIATGGRGLAAAKMKPKDAAALIIGASASTVAIRAAEVVEEYKALTLRSISPKNAMRGGLKNQNLFRKNFGDTLEHFIDLCSPTIGKIDLVSHSIVAGVKTSIDLKKKLDAGSDFDSLIGIEIGFIRPQAAAQIEVIDRSTSEIIARADYGSSTSNSDIDRYEITKISQKTIRALGSTIFN